MLLSLTLATSPRRQTGVLPAENLELEGNLKVVGFPD
jgi:hypothetical protein